jgi:pleiotropic regulator 1
MCTGPSRGGPAAAGAAAAGSEGSGDASRPESRSHLAKLIDKIPAAPVAGKKAGETAAGASGSQVVLYQAPGAGGAEAGAAAAQQRAVMAVLSDKGGNSSAAVSRRLASKWPRPVWHAPWKMYRVISGHLG